MKSIHSKLSYREHLLPYIAVKNAVEGPVMLARSWKQISPQALVHARASAKNSSYTCTQSPHILIIQWNLSIVGTLGTELAVLYREVSLIQR